MTRIVSLVLLLLASASIVEARQFSSPWVNSLEIPSKSRRKLEKRLERWSSRADIDTIMTRIMEWKPEMDRIAAEMGVDPWLVYGLVITESQGDPMAVDYMFKSGKSSRNHVGFGQLNVWKLDQLADDPRIKVRSSKWQRTHIRRVKIERRLKYHRISPALRKLLERELRTKTRQEAYWLSEWAEVDPRFHPKWNLYQTLLYFVWNWQRSGDLTLAIMAHHGGTNDPIRRVIRYARDHYHICLSPKDVPEFVRKHGINYFVLYEDQNSPGSAYWALKGDGHLTYGFAPVVWSELFARWLANHPEKKKINYQMVRVQKDNERPGTKTDIRPRKENEATMATFASFNPFSLGSIASDATTAGSLISQLIPVLIRLALTLLTHVVLGLLIRKYRHQIWWTIKTALRGLGCLIAATLSTLGNIIACVLLLILDIALTAVRNRVIAIRKNRKRSARQRALQKA